MIHRWICGTVWPASRPKLIERFQSVSPIHGILRSRQRTLSQEQTPSCKMLSLCRLGMIIYVPGTDWLYSTIRYAQGVSATTLSRLIFPLARQKRQSSRCPLSFRESLSTSSLILLKKVRTCVATTARSPSLAHDTTIASGSLSIIAY